jgi:hypothetical protein
VLRHRCRMRPPSLQPVSIHRRWSRQRSLAIQQIGFGRCVRVGRRLRALREVDDYVAGVPEWASVGLRV